MPAKERVSDVRGLPVFSNKEGRQVGTVSRIFVDPKGKKLAGISVGARRSEERFVNIKQVKLLGEDLVLVSNADALGDMPDDEQMRNLKDLQGLWVTALDGSHLGTLVDLDAGSNWAISELRLADDRALPIDAKNLTIGEDEILVPIDAKEHLVAKEEDPENHQGLLSRMFGAETTEEVATAIRRVLSRTGREDDNAEPMEAEAEGDKDNDEARP